MAKQFVYCNWPCPKCGGTGGFDESHGSDTMQCLVCSHVWLGKSHFHSDLDTYLYNQDEKLKMEVSGTINTLIEEAEDRGNEVLRSLHKKCNYLIQEARNRLQLSLETDSQDRELDRLSGMVEVLESIVEDIELMIGPLSV